MLNSGIVCCGILWYIQHVLKHYSGEEVKDIAKITIVAVIMFSLVGCGKKSEEKASEAAQLISHAQDLINSQSYPEALSALHDAARINIDLGNDTALANTYLAIGACEQQMGNYDSASLNYQFAGQYFHTIGNEHLEWRGRIILADFYSLLGKDREALLLASNTATAAKLISDQNDWYAALGTVVRADHHLKLYDDEQQALQDMRQIDSLSRGGQAQDSLYRLLFRSIAAQDKPEKIQQIFQKWCSFATTEKSNSGLASAWYEYGRWHQRTGRLDSAVHCYSHALDYLVAVKTFPLQVDIWSALGNIAYSQRKLENARNYFSNGLEMAQKFHRRASEILLRLSLLATDWKRQPHESIASYRRTAEGLADTCHQAGYRRAEALSLYLAGMFAAQQNDQSAAFTDYRKVWNIVRESFDDVDEENDFCTLFLSGEGKDWLDPLLRFYSAEGKTDSVFILAEEFNRHDLLNFMSRLPIHTADENLNHQIEDIQWKYQSIRLLEHDTRDVLEHSGKQASLRLLYLAKQAAVDVHDIDNRTGELATTNKNFSLVLSLKPHDMGEIRGTLPEGSALVEFIPLEDNLQILVAKRDTANLYRSAVNRSYLLSLLRDYLQLMGELRLTTYGLRMSEPAALQRINELSSVLYSILLAPISRELKQVQKLYIVLPEYFSWLPVHTLRGDGGAIGQRVNISYLPSADVLLYAKPQEHWVKNVVGLGYPGSTSWDVEYELKDIRSFFDKAPMYFDTAATLPHLRNSQYDLLHLALEFFLDRSDPGNSRVVLADGRPAYGAKDISLGEMLDIPTPEILVFSNISNIPGSLSRYAPLLFLANGTSTVITSMWQGDRRAKKAFGEGFYTSLFMGSTASEAYFKSVATMAKSEDLNHVQRWGLYYQFGK